MKLKHFSGYGTVNAKKTNLSQTSDIYGNPSYTMTVRVTGEHEYGLVRTDHYDVFNWLLKRFDKTVKDMKYWECIQEVQVVHQGYEEQIGIYRYPEIVDYIIVYKK